MVAGIQIPDPGDLLSGARFEAADIHGAVEEDFFNWVLHGSTGADLVRRTALQVDRFRLDKVDVDVLKILYESLIDPEQRHDLGEYYTPDWLASGVCDAAISDPLKQRVLDPACGSGTFVFHAARRYLAAAEAAGKSQRETVQGCCDHVFGIDVHPVAAIIARVTFLLALGTRLQGDRGPVNVPVYLGDSLQWNTARFLVEGEILMGLEGEDLLHFPASVAREPGTFDNIVAAMVDHAEQKVGVEGFGQWLNRNHPLDVMDDQIVRTTYTTLKRYYDEGRNHIWAYLARNMSRPIWLASTGQRADVIVGNPPWLSYRYMSDSMQQKFRDECKARGIWAGGNVATHQDLSALFYAKSVELYLQLGGRIALVMPYASLNRKQFEGFRKGWWGTGRGRTRRVNFSAQARFIEAWTFDEHVQPLFPVPSCVLFAENRAPVGLPAEVRCYRGDLPRRDASSAEASEHLSSIAASWPTSAAFEGGSPYREAFRQGATVVPRVFWRVDRVAMSGLGGSESAPLVHSVRTNNEKEPWKSLPSLHRQVEREFLRPLLLGESIAPFRVLDASLAVIPWDSEAGSLLDASSARDHGWPRLAAWLGDAETLWDQHHTTGDTLAQGLDHYAKLSHQFPIAPLRVLYTKSGTNAAAVVCRTPDAVIDHTLYWTVPESESEAYYLVALINSETVRTGIAATQARGQWGARHFDKVMFDLPIPRFDPENALHRQLADAAREAEEVAASVEPNGRFVAIRGRIREALAEDGIGGQIELLVATLLAAQSG